MKIEKITSDEYKKLCVNDTSIVYDSIKFLELNAYKVRKVYYYSLYDDKVYFLLALGECEEGCLKAPFSAPFCLLEPVRKRWQLRNLDESVECVDNFFRGQYKSVRFILPPEFYASKLVTAFMSALLRNGYTIQCLDLNYFFDLRKINGNNYQDMIYHNERRNLRIATENGLELFHCTDEEGKKVAYDIIAINRNERGYPLRMTWEQVDATIKIVPHDFFLVQKAGVVVASAIVFHVTKDIGQVIYWGNVGEYSSIRPMNFLAQELVKFYSDKGFQYLDIGPSSENGLPNYGLCNFKERIGCELTAKFILSKSYV